MKVEELIKKYEEELSLCDYRMEENAKDKEYTIAEIWRLRKKSIHLFLADLKELI